MFLIKRFSNVLYLIGGIFIIGMMLLIVVNVILRAITGSPISGTYELASLCAVLFVGVSIPVCTLADSHIKVDIISQKFKNMPKLVIDIITRVLDCLAGVILTYTAFRLAMRMVQTGESTSTLDVPIWPFRFIWMICAALIVVASVYRIVLAIKNRKDFFETPDETEVEEKGGSIE